MECYDDQYYLETKKITSIGQVSLLSPPSSEPWPFATSFFVYKSDDLQCRSCSIEVNKSLVSYGHELFKEPQKQQQNWSKNYPKTTVLYPLASADRTSTDCKVSKKITTM